MHPWQRFRDNWSHPNQSFILYPLSCRSQMLKASPFETCPFIFYQLLAKKNWTTSQNRIGVPRTSPLGLGLGGLGVNPRRGLILVSGPPWLLLSRLGGGKSPDLDNFDTLSVRSDDSGESTWTGILYLDREVFGHLNICTINYLENKVPGQLKYIDNQVPGQ